MKGVEANEAKRRIVQGVPPAVLNKLPDAQKKVLERRFLDRGGKIPTIRKLAEDEGITFQAILDAENRAFQRLEKLRSGEFSFPTSLTFSGRPRVGPTGEEVNFIKGEGRGLSIETVARRLRRGKSTIVRWRRELNLPPLREGRPRKNVVK